MEEINRTLKVRITPCLHGQEHSYKDEPNTDKHEATVDELHEHEEEGDEGKGEEKEE